MPGSLYADRVFIMPSEEYNLNRKSDRVALDLFWKKFGENIDSDLALTVKRVAENYAEALRANVPYNTGNLKTAVFENTNFLANGRFASAETVSAGNFDKVDVQSYAGFRETYGGSGERPVSALDYVMAQNYGDHTVAKMKMPATIVDGASKKNKENGYVKIDQREIFPLGFIEDSQAEALAKVDIEVAKFMREELRAR